MKKKTKANLIKAIAVGIDAGVPFIATLTQFPIWVDESASATVSGLFLIFSFLSMLPFLRQIREYFKSPSAWVIWLILFCLFLALRNIIDQMLTVCLAGLVANIIGSWIYQFSKRFDSEV